MKKVTLQDVADSLGVSRISVWKVFSGRQGVSTSLRNKIIQKATELNYNFPKDFILPSELQTQKQQLNISVTVSNPDNSIYNLSLIHDIAKELSKKGINLLYTYLPSKIDASYQLPPQLKDGRIDGIIIINVYNPQLIHLLSELSIPKIYMDTSRDIDFDSLHGDLILTSESICSSKLTQFMVSHNRSRIGFIGNITKSFANYELYKGYAEGLILNQLPLDKSICCFSSDQDDIISFLHSLDQYPDAFICSNDHIAFTVWKELEALGFEVPNDIMISGYHNISGYENSNMLTSVQTFNKDIAIVLSNQIEYRIMNPMIRSEIINVSSQIVFRDSTGSVQ